MIEKYLNREIPEADKMLEETMINTVILPNYALQQ